MKIVAILGEARTGKDHAAGTIYKVIESLGRPVVIAPIADRLRAMIPKAEGETKEMWSIRLVEHGRFYAERYGQQALCDAALDRAVNVYMRDKPRRHPKPIVILPDVRRDAEFDLVLRRDPGALVIRLNARPETRRERMGGTEEWERYLAGRGRDVTESALRGVPRIDARVFEIPSNDEAEFESALMRPLASWIAALPGANR